MRSLSPSLAPLAQVTEAPFDRAVGVPGEKHQGEACDNVKSTRRRRLPESGIIVISFVQTLLRRVIRAMQEIR